MVIISLWFNRCLYTTRSLLYEASARMELCRSLNYALYAHGKASHSSLHRDGKVGPCYVVTAAGTLNILDAHACEVAESCLLSQIYGRDLE